MPVQTGSAEVAGEVLSLCRSTMNELLAAGETPAVWTDEVLLPFLNSAYRRLQKDLTVAGVRHTHAIQVIQVPSGTTQLDDGSDNGLLPSDYLHPLALAERPQGSSETATALEEVFDGLPQRERLGKLLVYEELEGSLCFIGATANLDLILTYEKQLPKLVDAASPLRIRGAIDALAARTAMGAARARGVTALAADLRGQYEEEKALWLAEYWRHKQRTPARRRPYGSRRRTPFA